MATTSEDVWRILAELATAQAELTAAQKETDLLLKEVSQQQKENAQQLKETDLLLKEVSQQQKGNSPDRQLRSPNQRSIVTGKQIGRAHV